MSLFNWAFASKKVTKEVILDEKDVFEEIKHFLEDNNPHDGLIDKIKTLGPSSRININDLNSLRYWFKEFTSLKNYGHQRKELFKDLDNSWILYVESLGHDNNFLNFERWLEVVVKYYKETLDVVAIVNTLIEKKYNLNLPVKFEEEEKKMLLGKISNFPRRNVELNFVEMKSVRQRCRKILDNFDQINLCIKIIGSYVSFLDELSYLYKAKNVDYSTLQNFRRYLGIFYKSEMQMVNTSVNDDLRNTLIFLQNAKNRLKNQTETYSIRETANSISVACSNLRARLEGSLAKAA